MVCLHMDLALSGIYLNSTTKFEIDDGQIEVDVNKFIDIFSCFFLYTITYLDDPQSVGTAILDVRNL